MIHDEWTRNLAASAPAIPKERLQNTRRLMNEALPTAMVTGYEEYVPAVSLPDPNDCHVVAAAIAATASVIISWNLRHFPANELKKFGLRCETPDVFLCGIYEQVPELMIGSLANARRNLTKTNVSGAEFIDILKNQKLKTLAKRSQNHLTDL